MGLASIVLRPALVLIDLALHRTMWLLIHPTDEPRAVVLGDNPDRVLIFGNFLATGWGVGSHQTALPGALARAVSAITGRGAEVEVVGTESIVIANAAERLGELKLEWYDGVVLVLGVSDALRQCPPSRWRTGMTALLTRTVAETPAATPIVVTGIPSVRQISVFRGLPGIMGERHANVLNAITEELCAGYADVTFVPLAPIILTSDFSTAGALYEVGAVSIAADLAPRLATIQ